jgi:hypothetical protein
MFSKFSINFLLGREATPPVDDVPALPLPGREPTPPPDMVAVSDDDDEPPPVLERMERCPTPTLPESLPEPVILVLGKMIN